MEKVFCSASNPDEIITFVKINNPDILALSAPQGTLETLDLVLTCLTQFTAEKRPQIILGNSLPAYLSTRFFEK